MKLKFIGTGNITAIENSASYLIDDHVLVDCGNGIVKAVGQAGHEVNDIDLLVITHLHGDHFLDIPFLIMKRCFTGADNELKILCPKGTRKAVDDLMVLAYPDVFDFPAILLGAHAEFVEYETESSSHEYGKYTINTYPVAHGAFEDAYGLTISDRKSTIGFSGDSAYCDSIDTIVENSDVSVLDMSFVKGGYEHMGLDTMDIIVNKFRKPIYATHMSKASREKGCQINLAFLHVPEDGDEIEI